MMDIVFSDSACGSMKLAQHYGDGTQLGVSVGVVVTHHDGSQPSQAEIDAAQKKAEAKARAEWAAAVPLGGSAADVYGFSLGLSMGDIDEDVPGPRRLAAMQRLFSVYPAHPDCEGGPETPADVARQMLTLAQRNLAAVRQRWLAGEDMRLWYSQAPEEACGLHWLMAQLEDWLPEGPEEKAPGAPVTEAKAAVSGAGGAAPARPGAEKPDAATDKAPAPGQLLLIALPAWGQGEDGQPQRQSAWADVAPGQLHRYLPLAQPAGPALHRALAQAWHALRRENAPLRAVLNGQLVSMPETLYDDLLRRELAGMEEVFSEAQLIGRVLGACPLGISDAWLALRVEAMIAAGQLKAVDAPPPGRPLYHRRLRKLPAARA